MWEITVDVKQRTNRQQQQKLSDSQYSGGTDGGKMFLQGSKSGGHVV